MRTRLALLLGALSLAPCRPPPSPRVGTYNIRRLGVEATDLDALAEVVLAADADVLALQEVMTEAPLVALESTLAARGRTFAHTLSRCGGRSEMRVGFLYDTARARLLRTREFAGLDPRAGDVCSDGDRSGLVGEFVIADTRVDLMAVHFAAGGSLERSDARRAQWQRALDIVALLRREGSRRVVLMGDANSTGWNDNRHAERDFIEASTRDAGLDLASRPLPCSEYWRPDRHSLVPSVLDHVVATPDTVRPATLRVRGYCERLACRSISRDETPAEYAHVSDHCPVTVGLW